METVGNEDSGGVSAVRRAVFYDVGTAIDTVANSGSGKVVDVAGEMDAKRRGANPCASPTTRAKRSWFMTEFICFIAFLRFRWDTRGRSERDGRDKTPQKAPWQPRRACRQGKERLAQGRFRSLSSVPFDPVGFATVESDSAASFGTDLMSFHDPKMRIRSKVPGYKPAYAAVQRRQAPRSCPRKQQEVGIGHLTMSRELDIAGKRH